jgi:cell wall-associated NlpC family hydrolase
MAPGAAADLEERVTELVQGSASAPLQVVQLEVHPGLHGPVVTGRVLTFDQARAVGRLAADHGASVEIDVLADPDRWLEEGWLEITRDGPIEVWRDPRRMGEDRARQTEYLPDDGPLRQLGRRADGLLVQGPDLTVGWVAAEGLAATPADAGRRRWSAVRRAVEAEAVLPAVEPAGGAGGEPVALLTRGLRAELGVGYRWGGTTHRGFDCSGLVQRVISQATGVLLPKHTGDQRHVGARVPAAEARVGDLLFATPRQQRVGHVMVLTSSETVIHACRTEMKVIEEPISVNAQRYQHQGYRRPVRLHP